MNIKLNPVKKPFEIYCSFDPAIDQEKSNIKKYIETRDVSHLVFKPDVVPTKIFLKPIPRGIFVNAIAVTNNPATQAMLAFQYCIDRIENLKDFMLNEGVEIQNNGLSVWEPTEVFTTVEGLQIKYIDKDDVENCFNLTTIMEVSSVALKKTNYVPGTKLTYPVLPTSIEAIEAMR